MQFISLAIVLLAASAFAVEEEGTNCAASLTYAIPATFTVDVPFNIVPNFKGDNAKGVKFAISEKIPGVTLATTGTGALGGAFTTASNGISYTITLTNSCPGSPFQFTFTPNVLWATPTMLNYPVTNGVYTQCTPISNTPTLASDVGPPPSLTFTSSPPLPAGVHLNVHTGAITGVSLQVVATQSYTITVTNAEGSTSTSVQITVGPGPPTKLWYNNFDKIDATRGRYLYPMAIWVGCGHADSFSITPALPEGLQFNTKNGAISGQPTVTMFRSKYQVTATNAQGSNHTLVRIRVFEAPAYLLKRLGWKPYSG